MIVDDGSRQGLPVGSFRSALSGLHHNCWQILGSHLCDGGRAAGCRSEGLSSAMLEGLV